MTLYYKDASLLANDLADQTSPASPARYTPTLLKHRTHAAEFAHAIARSLTLPTPHTQPETQPATWRQKLLGLCQHLESNISGVAEALGSETPTATLHLNFALNIDPHSQPRAHYTQPTLQVIFGYSAPSAYEAVAGAWLNGDTLKLRLLLHRPNQPSLELHNSRIGLHRISVTHSLQQAYQHALYLLQHGLCTLKQQPERLDQVTHTAPKLTPEQPLWDGAVRSLIKRYYRYAGIKLIERVKFEHWQITWQSTPEHQPDSDTQPIEPMTPTHALPQQRLPHKADVLDQADPFIAETDSHSHVFFEQVRRGEKRGVIAVHSIRRDAQPEGGCEVVLEEPFHLSYPHVFQVGTQWFMLPECAESGQVRLYRALDFPRGWELATILMENVRLYDPTVHFHQGRWWLFGTQAPIQGMDINAELFLYSSETLDSQSWQPHPQNPIVSDCRRARPAGAIHRLGTRLIRPAQYCAPRYGYGISYQEIIELSLTHYCEQTWYQRLPTAGSGVLAQHSHNVGQRLVVSDSLVHANKRRLFANRHASSR